MACWVRSSSAQTSELFITTSDTNDIYVVQGGEVIRQWKTVVSAQEGPIAVNDSVRTAGINLQGQGAEYTLHGIDTGKRFLHPEGIAELHDGATDGEFNYVVEDDKDVGVFRTDLAWANPVLLFRLTVPELHLVGIAFDETDSTLWLVGSTRFDPVIEHRTLDGRLLGSFVPKGELNSALALDAADDTLWVAERTGQGVLRQYSKSGQLLQDLVVVGLNGRTSGAEFQFHPILRCMYEVTNVKKKRMNECNQSCDELPFEVGDQICGPVRCEDKSDCKKRTRFLRGCPNGAVVQVKTVLIGCTECTPNCSR